ncbi:MAG: alpha/beta fold hydrolase [Actinomycetota bacterium]
MAADEKSVELRDGVTLRYVERGKSSGLPLLLLPGLGDSWRSFGPVLEHLPRSIRAFALTQRGHGDASHPREGYGFSDFSADLEALLDALTLRTVVTLLIPPVDSSLSVSRSITLSAPWASFSSRHP